MPLQVSAGDFFFISDLSHLRPPEEFENDQPPHILIPAGKIIEVGEVSLPPFRQEMRQMTQKAPAIGQTVICPQHGKQIAVRDGRRWKCQKCMEA